MILSRKYKEELNKIVMSEEMKKRILHNVLNENIEPKSTMETANKYSLPKRNMQVIAACFTVVACLSVVKSYPQLLKHENINSQQEEISEGIDEENKVIPSDEDSKANENKDNSKIENIKTDDNKNNSENDNKDNNTNTGANNDDKTQESQSINKYKGNVESSKENGSANSNENSDKYINKNSPPIEQQETNPVNPTAKLNEVPDTVSNLPPNVNNQGKEPISSDKVLKNTVKNQDETAKKKVSDDNGTDSAPMTIAGSVYFIKEYKTLEEAENTVGFEINPIKTLPKGFSVDNISVESNQIIKIEYNSGQDIISFRAGREVDNISGDYNDYEFENTVDINGVSISLKGNKINEVNLATWKKDSISYSISDVNGDDKDMILNMIKSSL